MFRVQSGVLVLLSCLWALVALPRVDAEAALERGGGEIVMLQQSDRSLLSPVQREESIRMQKAAKHVLAKIVDEQVDKVKKVLGANIKKSTPKCLDKDASCSQLAAKAAANGNGCSEGMRVKCKKSCGACPPTKYEPSKSQYAKLSQLAMMADQEFDREFNEHVIGQQNQQRVNEATFARAVADRTKKMASFAAKEVALANAKVQEWKKKAAAQGSFAEANLATQALKALAVSKLNYHKLSARAKETAVKASKKAVDGVHLKIAVLLQGCQGKAPLCPHGEVYWGEIAAMRKAVAEINGDIGAEAMEGVEGVKLPKGYQIKLVEEMFADMDELLRVSHKISQDNTVLAVIAPGSTLFTTAVAPVFRLHSKPVIAWGAQAPQLSSMNLYPNVWRLSNTPAAPVAAVVDILQHYSWDRVGVIMNLDAHLDLTYKQLQSKLAGTGIQITATALDVPTSQENCNPQEIAAKLRYMAATKPKAVVFWPYHPAEESSTAKGCLDAVVEAAETAGLLNDQVSWLLTDDQFFNIQASSQQKLEGALMLRVSMPKAVKHWQTSVMAGVCAQGRKEGWAVGEGQKTSGRCCRGESAKAPLKTCRGTSQRSVLAYDSIYTASHAVAKAIEAGAATPENVLRSMGKLKFAGLSDLIAFDENGDRLIAFEIFNLRSQPSAQKYAAVGKYSPSQFEGQRLMIPDETLVVMHQKPESSKAGVCWVGGAHPYLYQKCQTCDRRTQQTGIRGQRNSCITCEPGSALFPTEPGSKFGQCRAFAAPFTCTQKQLLADADIGPRMCLMREKCRQCRGQCTGFAKSTHAATSNSPIDKGLIAPNFCPPFWQSYGSELNYHTHEECVPKIQDFNARDAPRTCSKTTTTWEQHLIPRSSAEASSEDNSSLGRSRPRSTTLGMFYVTPQDNQQHVHHELGESASVLEAADVHRLEDTSDASASNEESGDEVVPAKAKKLARAAASLSSPVPSDTIVAMSACQCHKRIDCNQGACNSAKTCTCAETCYLTTGNNAYSKCQGGVLRAALSMDRVQAALGTSLQGGDYCCFVECKIGKDAPEFMKTLAKSNGFCRTTVTTL